MDPLVIEKPDTSKDFNTIPLDYPTVKDFDVSKSLTTIDFAIVQGLDPFYLVRHQSIFR